MKFVILLLSIFFASIFCTAQQDPFLTSEGFGPFIHNPASFGSLNALSVQSVGRIQWAGLISAPKILAVNAEASLIGYNKKDIEKGYRLGVGLNGIFQEIGFINYQSFTIPFNFQFKIKSTYLSIGIAPGFLRSNFVFSGLSYQTKFDMDAGIFWYSKKFNGGLAVTHAIPPNFDGWVVERHYMLQGAYNFNIGKGKLIPMVQTKFDGAGVAIQLLTYYQFPRDIVTIGLGYRLNTSVILSTWAQFKGMRLGYVIDYNTNALGSYYPISHEFRLGFVLPKSD